MRILSISLMCCALFGEGIFSEITLEKALAEAAKGQKIVLIDFYTTWCGPCKLLDKTTWKDEGVITLLKQQTISLKIDAEKNIALSNRYSITGYPTILLVKPDGSVLDRIVGYQTPDQFVLSFRSALKGITALDRARFAVSESNKGNLESQVLARYNLAKLLAEKGQYENALREYLWLYDEGMKRSPGYSGVRSSYLLQDINRLGQRHPSALEQLLLRRNTARSMYLAAPEDYSLAMDLTSLNKTLKDNQASVEIFDLLPPGSPGQMVLGLAIWDELIARKRYTDASKVRLLKDILGKIENMEENVQKGQPATPEIEKMIHAVWLELAVSGVEVFVGVGQLDDARVLVKKALSIDPSTGTKTLINTRIQRTGKSVSFESLQ